MNIKYKTATKEIREPIEDTIFHLINISG